MDEPLDPPADHWPDFVPPDLAGSIGSAPSEQPAPPPPPPPPPTVSGPVLTPMPGGRARRADPSGERWFRSPAQPGWRSSPIFSPSSPTVVTNLLISLCLVVWIGQLFVFGFHDMMMLIPSAGAAEPWRFLTAAFAHTPRSLTHIGFNMLTLWLMGRYLEPILGHAKFLAVYLISALGGNALFVLLAFPMGQGPGGYGHNWNSGLVGASGAVFGLFGAYMVIAWLLRKPLTGVWVLLGLNLVMAVLFPSIAWQAHLGGFLAGAAATASAALALKRQRGRRGSSGWIGMAIVTAAIIVALVVKYAVTL